MFGITVPYDGRYLCTNKNQSTYADTDMAAGSAMSAAIGLGSSDAIPAYCTGKLSNSRTVKVNATQLDLNTNTVTMSIDPNSIVKNVQVKCNDQVVTLNSNSSLSCQNNATILFGVS